MDCGYTLEPPRRGGSNEYPQSMFWSKNTEKNNRFCYIKVGFKGVYLTQTRFHHDETNLVCHRSANSSNLASSYGISFQILYIY